MTTRRTRSFLRVRSLVARIGAKMLQPFEAPICRYSDREGERQHNTAVSMKRGDGSVSARHLVNVDVHVFSWDGSVSLCAWLSRAQFEHMVHSGESAWFTEKWLSGLEPDPTVAPPHRPCRRYVLFRKSHHHKNNRSSASLMFAVPKRLRSLFHRRDTWGILSMSSDRWLLACQNAMTL